MIADYDDRPSAGTFDAASWQREMMESCDDQSFCDLLFAMLQTRYPGDDPLATMFEPWILQRLKLMRERAPHIYIGSFVTKARRLYPGRVVPAELQEAMRGADTVRDGRLGDVEADTLLQQVVDLAHYGAPPGVHPGWSNLAMHYTPKPGQLSIVTGVASHMKSLMVQALCINIARGSDWRFGIFSPENYPPGEFVLQLIEQTVGRPYHQLPDDMLLDIGQWVLTHFHCIEPPEEIPPMLDYLLAVARVQVQRYHIQGLILDPWNQIDHQFGYRQNETQYISEALSRILRFAQHHRVHVWLVAHPTKLRKAESGPYAGLYPPPTPYDISGSAHFYNKADNCLSVWRNALEDSPCIEVHVQKVRQRRYGKPGMIKLEYRQGIFVEAPEEEQTWPV